MPKDISVYFEVVREVQEQVNRITYLNHLTEQDRLQLLEMLERDFKQKLLWAKRSMSYADTNKDKEILEHVSLQLG